MWHQMTEANKPGRPASFCPSFPGQALSRGQGQNPACKPCVKSARHMAPQRMPTTNSREARSTCGQMRRQPQVPAGLGLGPSLSPRPCLRCLQVGHNVLQDFRPHLKSGPPGVAGEGQPGHPQRGDHLRSFWLTCQSHLFPCPPLASCLLLSTPRHSCPWGSWVCCGLLGGGNRPVLMETLVQWKPHTSVFVTFVLGHISGATQSTADPHPLPC